MFTNSLLLVALRNDFNDIHKDSFVVRDCRTIKTELNVRNVPVIIKTLKLYEIYYLWSMFSEQRAAGWLIVCADTMNDFVDFLSTLHEETEE